MNEINIDERIILDHDKIYGDIENIVSEVSALRSDKLFAKAMGAAHLQEITDYCALIKKRLYDAFNIVVIGDFKRGKSTLINAIIGEDIVPTAVTPETVTINKISFSETPKAEAFLKNGKKAALSYNELKREAIEKIIEKLPAEIDYIDIRSNAEVLKEITIIDTPGIGDLLKAFDEKVAGFLLHADALIYVISATSPLSMTEQAFLSSAVMPQSFSRIFAVVNMADAMETAGNIERITESIREKIIAISPDMSLFVLSALDEVCRKKNLKRPEPNLADLLENNFLEFENALNSDIILQKDFIKSSRAVSLARIMLNDTANRIKLTVNSLNAHAEKFTLNEEELKNENSSLVKSIESKKGQLASEIEKMKTEAANWITEFMVRLKNEINSIKETVSVSDLERHFQFFMSDLIKSALSACTERHKKDIQDKIKDFSKGLSEEVTLFAFGNVDAQIAGNIADISWTGADSAMFFGEMLGAQFLGPIYIIGQAVAGFIRQSAISKKQSDFLAPLLENYDSICKEVLNNSDTVYEQLKLTAIDKLQETFNAQIESSLDAIKQARQIATDETIKKEEAVDYLGVVLSTLENHNKTLERYQN